LNKCRKDPSAVRGLESEEGEGDREINQNRMIQEIKYTARIRKLRVEPFSMLQGRARKRSI
jgi:hypothetical protein